MQDEEAAGPSGYREEGTPALPVLGSTARTAGKRHEAEALQDPDYQGGMEGSLDEPGGREFEASESGEGAKASVAKRSEELLLKNRRAQRRFRERQKGKISELEEKNAELTADMKRLQQDNQNLDSRLAALVRLVHQKNAQLDQLRSTQAAGAFDEEVATAFTDDLSLTWSEGQVFSLTPEQVRGLSREDMSKIWKEYVQQLAALLGDADGKHPGAQASALEQIKRLTHELTMVLLRVSICSPLVAKSLAAVCMEESSMAEENIESSCRSCMTSMMLSSEQRAELIQLRQLFLNKQAAIMEQRGDILATLLGTMQVPAVAATERIASTQYLKAHEASTLLRQSLREEHALKLDFLSTVLKHLITPVQLARLLVQSYPWFPDTLALTTWLAAEAGDPQAVSFFSQGRSMLMLPPGPAPLSLGSRGANSGFSTPRHATPTTPPRTTAAATPFHLGGGQPLSPGGGSFGMLLPQGSAHSGISQMGGSPLASPLYTPHASPSPPLSPAAHLMPGPSNPPQ